MWALALGAYGSADDPDLLATEYGVEGFRQLGAAVVDEEAHRPVAVVEVTRPPPHLPHEPG